MSSRSWVADPIVDAPPPEDYTVAWIIAPEHDAGPSAAEALLDEFHGSEIISWSKNDKHKNGYSMTFIECGLGRVGTHNVSIAAVEVPTPIAAVALNIAINYTSVRLVLMITTAQGIPRPGKDIRLGDVVIGSPHLRHLGDNYLFKDDQKCELNLQDAGGLLSVPVEASAVRNLFDLDLRDDDESAFLSTLGDAETPTAAIEIVSGMNTVYSQTRTETARTKLTPPHPGTDRLFRASYKHQGGNCDNCDPRYTIIRQDRPYNLPSVHIGTTVSHEGSPIEDGMQRDLLSSAWGSAICLATGTVNMFCNRPHLILQGIRGYADSHSNDLWRNHALISALACARYLLLLSSPKMIADGKVVPSIDCH